MQFVDTTNYSLPTQRQAQNRVFGSYTRKDMSDYSQAAYNYLMHQQDNALQIALMNYQNQYNSPQNQMLLRQAAGINPFSDYSVQGAASPQVGASPQMRSTGAYSKAFQNGMNAVSQILNAVKTARDTYDYARFGPTQQRFKTQLLGHQVQAQQIANDWNAWLTYGDQGAADFDDPQQIRNSPRGQSFQSQTEARLASIDRMKEMVNLIEDQELRQKALTALDEYRLDILKGQNDAILNIDTGFSGLDSFLKALFMFLQRSLTFHI